MNSITNTSPKSVELRVTWDEFRELAGAPDDETGAALINIARSFLTPDEVSTLVRLHRDRAAIYVNAQHELQAPRIHERA